MLPSPAKRRKTSPKTAAPVNTSDKNERAVTEDRRASSVLHRLSFQSPTKASLARSHPEILSRVLSRSPARSSQQEGNNAPTGGQFGLRGRKALRPSLTASGTPVRSSKRLSGLLPHLSPRKPSGIHAFAAPPRRVSKRISSSDDAGNVAQATLKRDGSNEVLAYGLDGATPVVRPPDGSVLPDESEPDLPPTPAELGLGKQPERLRDLSTSPSSRHVKRRRQMLGGGFKSSPLKPRDSPPSVEGEGPGNKNQDQVPEEAEKKWAIKKDLSAQLQRLKDEVAQLEHWAHRSERPGDYPEPDAEATDKLICLLTTLNPSCAAVPETTSGPPLSSLISCLLPFSGNALLKESREPSLPPTNPFTLKELETPKPYLAVFAPLELHSYSTRISTSSDPDVNPDLIELHELTLSAPFPFLRHMYEIPLTFTTDLGSQSITSISISTKSFTPGQRIPAQLLGWIYSRLTNPLLKLDISGLCWGIGQYWDAALLRARVWARLRMKHSMLIAGLQAIPADRLTAESSEDERDAVPTMQGRRESELRLVAPHLERTTMLFSSPGEMSAECKKLLLSCTMDLDDWTGEVYLRPEITVSASSTTGESKRATKVEREAKKLFHSLLVKEGKGEKSLEEHIINGDSIVRATEGVMGILFGVETTWKKRK